MVYCPTCALRTVIALIIVIQVLASLRSQTEGFSNFAENESKWKDRSRINRFARSDLGFALPVFLYRPTLNKSVWKHHTRVIKRQATYDTNIQDLEALVAAEEAKTADAANMAGQPGRGWSDWSPWSTCSIPCGPVGEQTRKRTCQNDPLTGVGCDGADTDTQTCKPALATCPETTSWSPWHEWGTCSVTCGDGVRTRERSCIVSDPKLNCPGDSAQTEPCNLQSCDLKESWTKWSAWSKCSVTCGAGHKSRERMCQDDATGVEAHQCPGKKHTTEVCDQPICSSGIRVKTVHAVEGHSAMLKCLYEKMTRPVSIYWLTPDRLKITHQSQNPLYEAIGDTLNIRHASSNMVGLYRCVVEDAHGKIMMGEAPVDVLDCTSRPCRNGGVCQEIQAVDHFNIRYTTYKCMCGPGYGGPICEGGIGPGNIAALLLCMILAGLACTGFCMIYRFRQSENKPTKLITPKESKLIVVTSRDALAVSCSESSSDATLSDSPVRQVDFDGNINAPPNLKTSRGIGAIFPKFGWNNNNSLYRVLPRQLAASTDTRRGYKYTLANTTDLSRSSSEVEANIQRSDQSDQSINANTNYNSECTSTTTTSSSSTDSLSSETSTERSSQSVSDSSQSTSSTSQGSSSSAGYATSSLRDDKCVGKSATVARRNVAYYCPSNSSLEARLKPAPVPNKLLNKTEIKNGLQDDQTPEKQSNQSQTGNSGSIHPSLLDTPKRPQPTYSYNFNRHNILANLPQSIPQKNLFNRPYPWDSIYNSTSVPEHCHSSENFIHNTLHSPSYALNSTQRSSSVPEQCHSSGSEQVLGDYTPRITTIQSNAPVVQGGYQHAHHSRHISDYSKVRNVDKNQSCTLQSDPTVMPEVDTLDPDYLRKGQADFHEESTLQMVKVTDTDYKPTFADLFHSLRAKLNKEREKTTAKVNRLTSIVSESSRCQTPMKVQSPGQFANIPAYGEPCTHAASSPLDPSSNSEAPARINLSMVLSDQTAISGDSSSDHFSVLCRISPDTPRE